jgi:hypothetical protein
MKGEDNCELESWYLADLAAVEDGLDINGLRSRSFAVFIAGLKRLIAKD